MAPLRAGDVVDYVSVAGLKWRALRKAYAAFRPTPSRAADRISTDSAPSAAPCCRDFACFEVLRHKFGKPWWEWPQEWRQPDDARCASACAPARTPTRSSSSNSCSGSPISSWALPRSRTAARHAGRALSRRRGRRTGRRLRRLERAGCDLAPSRRRRAARSAQHRRPDLGPRRLQCRWARADSPLRRTATCCAPRCATPAPSGSTMCSG